MGKEAGQFENQLFTQDAPEKLLSRRKFLLGTLTFTARYISAASALGLLSMACEEEPNSNFLSASSMPSETEDAGIVVPENYSSSKFLTNPFPHDSKMKIQQGWFYNWLDQNAKPAKHQGIDFIKGEIDNSDTWQPFDVLAAADGWVVANPPSRQGNAVFIKHIVNEKPIYTYYGHLEKIEDSIPSYYDQNGNPSKGKPIKRGERIGVAGASGVVDQNGNPQPKWIHLHFSVQDMNVFLDPFGEYGQRNVYPSPNSVDGKTLESNSLWKD